MDKHLVPKTLKGVIKEHLKSRKMFYCFIGIFIVVIGWLLSIYLVCKFPMSQASITTMYNGLISFIAGIVSIGCGTHTFMDWSSRNSSNSDVVNITKTVFSKMQPKDFQVPYSELYP